MERSTSSVLFRLAIAAALAVSVWFAYTYLSYNNTDARHVWYALALPVLILLILFQNPKPIKNPKPNAAEADQRNFLFTFRLFQVALAWVFAMCSGLNAQGADTSDALWIGFFVSGVALPLTTIFHWAARKAIQN